MLNLKWLPAIVVGIALIAGGPASAESRYGQQKVVYHVNYDDPAKQKSTLQNIQNHIDAVGKENVDLRVVLHGGGLSMVLLPESIDHLTRIKHANADEAMAARLDGLKNQGVHFVVCANTVKALGVDLERDTYDVRDDDIVPSGVAELSHLQAQGYTYLRP